MGLRGVGWDWVAGLGKDDGFVVWDEGLLLDFQFGGMVGGEYLVSWLAFSGVERTKPESGRRPSWHRRNPAAGVLMDFLDMKIGLLWRSGFDDKVEF